MIGDGVNDAPALVESDLSIAISAGADIGIESAYIFLVRSKPLDSPFWRDRLSFPKIPSGLDSNREAEPSHH